ncbi:hypothetical protein [Clostridium sp. OS1-26]|uniref:hypothetical protein n=1 Tax=Clostridium sp. OS1-26 TaxID=3070681 RepID=UPI0027DF761E|nr:hypothetical protein [Clostridium sp. OS1-26]WML36780.1 hypothetical protein RCG18_09210 [Clostridium sp. OS1-26]
MSKEKAYDIAHELIKVIKLLRRKTFDSSNNNNNNINLSSHMILHLLKDESKKH